jgi:hypothetical protein
MDETATGGRRVWQLLLLLTAFAMMASGLVIAISWLISVPAILLALAAVVAVFGLSVFFVVGVRQARQSGDGVLRSVGRAFWLVIRLSFELF